MNVTQNKIDDLTAIISITIQPEDYRSNVEKALNDYRKKVNMPGFRKGKVPMGIVKKQYEGAVTYEEINKVLNDTLNNFISENKLDILGQPLPVINEKQDESENENEMTFKFEIGLAPEITVDLSKATVPYYKIKATEKEVAEVISGAQTQFGEIIDAEEIGEDGSFVAKVQEIDEEGNPVEGGIDTTITLLVDKLKTKDSFLGKKAGDVIEITAQSLFSDVHELQHFLGLSHEAAHSFDGKLRITPEKISDRIKAELNQEFFDKLGKGDVTSEEELQASIKEEIEDYYKKESDTRFINDSVKWLLENVKVDLPSGFLIKFLQSTSKEPISDEKVAAEYEKSEESLRYQLIEKQILTDNKIKVKYQDLADFTRDQIKQQFAAYGYRDIPEEDLEKYVISAMKNEEHVRKSSSRIIQQELFKVFDSQITKKEQEVFFDEFHKL
ncbi:MAG: trigger factor [Flavobacteriaceae bacterium]|jgi:trigger factor|nr:trigger factor [Flavobacteriaceae bacterium]